MTALEIKKYQVNQTMVWQGKLKRIKGIHQEKPVCFYVRPLNLSDAEAMGNLSAEIYRNLRSGEECFIHKHNKEYYHKIFQNRDTHYVGIFVGKNLIGMSYLKICENTEALQAELPNTPYNFFHHGRNNNENLVGSLGADSVLPAYRGNALNSVMIDYRIALAREIGCTDCTSIVDRNNKWNMMPYFGSGFNLFATSVDPEDGGKISLLHKSIEDQAILSSHKVRIALPFDRLDMIDGLIKHGFVGISFDKADGQMTFAHSDYYSKQKEEASLQRYKNRFQYTM
jgi:hypothetical protein